MSIDTYFCFCCLSTDDLITLYGFNSEENYAELLSELFSVEPFQEDYVDDSYICSKCAQTVKEFEQFRRQIRATITILQSNGLIITENKNNQLIVRKATSVKIDDNKNCLNENDVDNNVKEIKQDDSLGTVPSPKKKPIKIENGIEIFKYLQKTESKINTFVPTTKGKIKEDKKVTHNFECKECLKKLPNMYMYHRHMNVHFPNYICDICGNGFLTQRKLKRHKTTHDEGPFICDVCNTEFKNYNSLISHRQRKHNPNFAKLTNQQKVGNYACSICDKTYSLYGSLYSHMRISHNKQKRYFCYLCADGFFHKQDLVAHENTHTRANMFKCAQCDKSYLRKKALTVHMRTHTNERRFGCDVCGKKFIQKCSLALHVKIHNPEAKS